MGIFTSQFFGFYLNQSVGFAVPAASGVYEIVAVPLAANFEVTLGRTLRLASPKVVLFYISYFVCFYNIGKMPKDFVPSI